MDALQTTSNKAIQKAREATGDLIGNKIVKKITKASRTSLQNSSETVTNKAENIRLDRDIPTKRYIYIYFKQQNIIDDLRLI